MQAEKAAKKGVKAAKKAVGGKKGALLLSKGVKKSLGKAEKKKKNGLKFVSCDTKTFQYARPNPV